MIQLEGRNPVLEALKSDREIEKIILKKNISGKVVDEIINMANNQEIAVKRVHKNKIKNRSKTNNSQGVIALAEPEKIYSVKEIIDYSKKGQTPPKIILLDHLKDPHNFGAILRTAYASGVDGVIFPSDRAAGITPVVRKTAAGAIEYIKLARVANINYTIKKLKDNNIWIAGLELEAEDNYYDRNLSLPLGIVIGSEGTGLKKLVKENCDFLLKIPMKENINSLNVSVATGIVLYEIYRQCHQLNKE